MKRVVTIAAVLLGLVMLGTAVAQACEYEDHSSGTGTGAGAPPAYGTFYAPPPAHLIYRTRPTSAALPGYYPDFRTGEWTHAEGWVFPDGVYIKQHCRPTFDPSYMECWYESFVQEPYGALRPEDIWRDDMRVKWYDGPDGWAWTWEH